MEEDQFRYGDIISADLKLWLTGPNEEKYEGNPVHLHSAILKRSIFFEVMMSERWSSGNPSDVRVTTSHNFDDYLKCIELLYGESVYFTNVVECLAILPVASELMADDLINKCMQYLEAVPWSTEQEAQIRDMLSSLGLKPIPDLAARLDKECADCVVYVETIIRQMVSLVQGKEDNKNRENAERYIRDILKENTPQYVVELLGRELLQQFKSSIESQDFLPLKSLCKLVDCCKGKILKDLYVAFVDDPKLAENVKELYGWMESFRFAKEECGWIPSCAVANKECEWVQSCGVIFETIILFMKAIGGGNITISRASRCSLLTTWLPIMTGLCFQNVDKLDELAKAAVNVIESLPRVDKMRICAEWIELYTKNGMDISTPLSLFKALHRAYH